MATNFIIGTSVVCTDSPCGHLERAVIDPEALTLTHLAVEPAHLRREGRLVPIELVASVDHEIKLRCTHTEFMALPGADVTETVGPGGVRLASDSGSGGDPAGFERGWSYGGVVEVVHKVTEHVVPPAELEVKRNDPVNAPDGVIGRLQGFSARLDDHKLTHVLVAEGVLWGKKCVAVPIDRVTALEGGIELKLTREQLKALPLVDLKSS
jgi:hypothetical protein